ncbi:hypothetical protein KTE91_03660 [Burkholderia multivorans]|uniref:hypothetical protein n=1 Tax=Burkholderia multivorans TaxID=87883 RepID=UPI001C244A4A|nr:hypothetical protein [Burkholderia multivorans]MBU9434180.1 hypothetical protein [Burkholderia multivorans]
MDDLIQSKFDEIRALHAELQDSEKYLDYLIEMNRKAKRLQDLVFSLQTILNHQVTRDDEYYANAPSFFYMSAIQENEDQSVWTVTDHGYIYNEEEMAEMEKLYLSHTLNRDLPESSTTSKKIKI